MRENKFTPKKALADYRWLRAHNFWHHFSLPLFTKQYWKAMYEENLVHELTKRNRLNRGSKAYNLAVALSEARAYHEAKDQGKSLRAALRASEGAHGEG